MERRWLNLPYAFWAAICLAVAMVYVCFWPRERAAPNTAALRLFLVSWGPSLAWTLLVAMCLLKAAGNPVASGRGNLAGLLAVPVYLGSFVASFVLR